MKRSAMNRFRFLGLLFLLMSVGTAIGQQTPVVLSGPGLTRVVPTGFYFEGQSAPTQMRNAAAARLNTNRHVVAGLVDTSGYSSEIRAKYEGFLIVDSKIEIGGHDLEVGAYGFGVTDGGKMNIFDVGGKLLLSVDAPVDRDLRRPRPLMMMVNGGELRLYVGRNHVSISAG